MRSFPFMQTSVFTDDRYSFGGNQLATFWDDESNLSLTPEEMLGIAREMNFSETTFVFKSTVKECSAKVRIFTPGLEIPFAGHPTIGTAFVLKRKKLIPEKTETSHLELGIGKTEVNFVGKRTVRMTQSDPKIMGELDEIKPVLKAIGLSEKVLAEDAPAQFISTGFPFLIIPIKTLSAIRRAVPNPTEILKSLKNEISQEIVILTTETIHSDSNVHVRMFAPGAGVLEDPATGSAAGPIGGYIEAHNLLPNHSLGEFIVIEQGFELNRPSRLVFQSAKVRGKKRVYVAGKISLMAEGKFFLKSQKKK
ncbi:MAG: PhzF family phenazine biosynthesis protein [Candidatus Thorarchaeota archaeon]